MILKDKVVIVTGAGPGMGNKLCGLIAEEGAKIVLAARSKDYIDEVAENIRKAGGQALAVKADVGIRADCDALAAAAVEKFGAIHGLVNSAYRPGVFRPFEEADLDDWKASLDVTLFGALNMIQAVLPTMKKTGGSIVNVGTMETRKPIADHGSYTVPKAALQAATRQLAVELGKYKIRINSAVIGWMWGAPVEFYMNAMSSQTGVPVETMIAQTAATIPLGHIPPDFECAKSIIALLSDYNSQVTGAAVDINGGEYLAL